MRLIGYCMICRGFRYVRVTAWANGTIAYGVCADCERKKQQ